MLDVPKHARVAYAGRIFRVYEWSEVASNGTQLLFEKVVATGSVNIVPITEDGHAIVARQTQPARASFEGLIGGRIEPGENPLDAAKRELSEELGMNGARWRSLGAYSAHVKVEWPQHYFVVEDLTSTVAADDPTEIIEPMRLRVDEFCRWVIGSHFDDYIFKSHVLAHIVRGGMPHSFSDLFSGWPPQ